MATRSWSAANLTARGRRTRGWLGAVGLDLRPRAGSLPGPAFTGFTSVLAAYGAVGAVSASVALALGHNPLACASLLGAHGPAAILLSLGLGVCLGAITVGVTRAIVFHAEWGRALHAALRPAVRGASDAGLLALAVASATGEELLFRGLLVPVVGVVASSLVFGALHQIDGRARWGWMAWATLMGALFGAMFVITGSLAGPLIAHAAINHVNLRLLRDSDPEPRSRPLGGLLNR